LSGWWAVCDSNAGPIP